MTDPAPGLPAEPGPTNAPSTARRPSFFVLPKLASYSPKLFIRIAPSSGPNGPQSETNGRPTVAAAAAFGRRVFSPVKSRTTPGLSGATKTALTRPSPYGRGT